MGRRAIFRRLMLASTALVPLGIAAAAANPLGPNVAGGSATVTGVGTPNVTINQSTPRAIINWNSFNIGAGETTRFVQPDASSVALNRVTGGLGPSQINGMLTANGKVFLVNPDGVLIGRGGVVNTAGFLATTNDITNANFMAGKYHFNIPGRPDASVVNEGRITAHSHGFAALVAPGVRNSGTITARYGKIGLASGNDFSLDFYGDQLITLAVGDSIKGQVRDVATGQPLSALVKNDGKLKATGGRVELTAAQARTVVDSVINNSGVIEARSVGTRNGRIVLGGSTTQVAGLPPQTVRVSGKLDVSSKKGTGGSIQVTGERIVVNAASFDASGATGGGRVLIGGDTGGGRGHWAVDQIPQAALEARAIPNATTVEVDATTVINASATSVGNGGKVIVWADGDTTFAGTILARGGASGGNGGFVEVSGKQVLAYSGLADTRAPFGSVGTLLLDPANYTVGTTDGLNSISKATLETNLAAGNVTITNNAGLGDGDIIVSNTNFIVWSANTLTLSAYRHIEVQAIGSNTATLNPTGTASLVMRADNTGIGTGTVLLNANTYDRRIDATATSGTVTIYYNPTSYSSPTDFTVGNGRIYTANSSQLTSYMLVNSLPNLVAIGTNSTTLAGRYALGNSNINGGTLTGITGPFTGVFDGLNNTIRNVTINGPSIIGTIGSTGIVRNVKLENFNLSASAQRAGILAGTNNGLIQNVSLIGGSVTNAQASGSTGGLVGWNTGTIRDVTLQNVALTAGAASQRLGIAVGTNESLALIENATISGGTVSGGSFMGLSLGGLGGWNNGTVRTSSSSATLTSAGLGASVGGLVGTNWDNGIIRNSSASGAVSSTASVPAVDCVGSSACSSVYVGGLVGSNSGDIFGTGGAFTTFASGPVTVGQNGIGGGLVGFNAPLGYIDNTRATGAVTGSSGAPTDEFDRGTLLGGLVGSNFGFISNSKAENPVGTASANYVVAGGFVGDNVGLIASSAATGVVVAGNHSQAGGFVGADGKNDCFACSAIGNSTASGPVTVGSFSIAGGFAGSSGWIFSSQATGAVTVGDNSILGGFVGVHNIGDFMVSNNASGPVNATGAATWAGGFVGFNGGVIFDSTTSSPVTGTSSSILGGFAGVNVGWIDPSFAGGEVTGSGVNNILGGFAGLNIGTITDSTSTGAVKGGANNIAGGFVGVNASLQNVPSGLIPYSSFPVGMIYNSSGSGSVTTGSGGKSGAQVAATNPGTLTYPGVMQNCTDTICDIFRNGTFTAETSSVTVPNQVQAPPVFQYMPDRQFLPNDALIRLTSLTTVLQDANRLPGTPLSQRPGTPPASLAPPRPLRPVAGPDGEIRSNIPPLNETRFLANEVVLHVLANTAPASVQQIAQQLGLTLITQQNLDSLGRTAYRVQIPPGTSVREIIRALETNSIVAVAQPNYTYTLMQQVPAAIAPFTASRGDPAQYTMGKLHLNEAHRVASGNNITVAVIDSEVDDHAELAGTILQRYDATDTAARPHSHGTAMAGAIVSRERLLGVAPGAKILAVRAFSETQSSAESTSFTILKGIEWAVGQGARVINMSFAGPYDPSLERALKNAAAKGVVLIGAAGNAGPKSPPLWPGADPSVIAVTATDSGDKAFRQANRGPYLSVASPGVEILAPAPQAGYQLSTGTSIATAHISGVVALMLERDPSLTPADVRLILESTAADLGPKGRDTQFGWGLVNPAKALAMVDERKRQKGTSSAPAPAATPVQR